MLIAVQCHVRTRRMMRNTMMVSVSARHHTIWCQGFLSFVSLSLPPPSLSRFLSPLHHHRLLIFFFTPPQMICVCFPLRCFCLFITSVCHDCPITSLTNPAFLCLSFPAAHILLDKHSANEHSDSPAIQRLLPSLSLSSPLPSRGYR